jgi:hypothetical protein
MKKKNLTILTQCESISTKLEYLSHDNGKPPKCEAKHKHSLEKERKKEGAKRNENHKTNMIFRKKGSFKFSV